MRPMFLGSFDDNKASSRYSSDWTYFEQFIEQMRVLSALKNFDDPETGQFSNEFMDQMRALSELKQFDDTEAG
jgi:hypothetical protein